MQFLNQFGNTWIKDAIEYVDKAIATLLAKPLREDVPSDHYVNSWFKNYIVAQLKERRARLMSSLSEWREECSLKLWDLSVPDTLADSIPSISDVEKNYLREWLKL